MNRRQQTLFLTDPERATAEAIRQQLDPVQHRLIPAHVTLCREDELAAHGIADLNDLPALDAHAPLTLQFGAPELFHGHGVLLPCVAGESEFHQLRVAILGSTQIRTHHAHITLAHPRNPRVVDDLLAACVGLTTPVTATFSRIALIEQSGSEPWKVRGERQLGARR